MIERRRDNMKNAIKFIGFITLFACLFIRLNEISIKKTTNRYYMLKRELESKDQDFDVQIYGSCHAYTSFNSKKFTEENNISSYNLSAPSEIIPTTYLKMKEQFKIHKPKIALLEIWGINAFDTYVDTDKILGDYLALNIEQFPYSQDKNEIIRDFDTLNLFQENIALFKYKERIYKNQLIEEDFNYSYDSIIHHLAERDLWIENEMTRRFANNGFSPLDSSPQEDYPTLQSYVNEDEYEVIEPVIMKYLDKIIDLCKENDVSLIFYRAPYVSKTTELCKSNYLREYLRERNILYFDLEKEIPFDYSDDFSDLQHLSNEGADKVTDFLSKVILRLYDNED